MALDRPPIAAEIRATLAVAAPLAAANLAQMVMQVTNAVMVGHLGAVPLAAAELGNALNATLLMTSQGLLTAVAPPRRGARRRRQPAPITGGWHPVGD